MKKKFRIKFCFAHVFKVTSYFYTRLLLQNDSAYAIIWLDEKLSVNQSKLRGQLLHINPWLKPVTKENAANVQNKIYETVDLFRDDKILYFTNLPGISSLIKPSLKVTLWTVEYLNIVIERWIETIQINWNLKIKILYIVWKPLEKSFISNDQTTLAGFYESFVCRSWRALKIF